MRCDDLSMSESYSFGDYLRTLAAQARARENRAGVVYLALLAVVLLVVFWAFQGPVVAVGVIGGSTLLSLLIGYSGERRRRQRP